MALITVFLGIAVTLWASDARAQDPYADAPPFDPSAAWCTDDLYISPGAQRYVPDGAITQVGPYYLRVCRNGSSSSAPGEKVMRFFYNPERVEGLSSVKVMTGLMVNALSSWDDKLQRLLSGHRRVGAQRIGSATYSVYRYVRPDGELGGATFLYEKGNVTREAALPPHMFECTQPVVPPYTLQGRCFLQIGYGKIRARLLFLSVAPGEPILIPVDRFPEFALDMKRVLETADVTDEYENADLDLPFLR